MKLRKLGIYFIVAMLMLAFALTIVDMKAYAEEDMGSWERKADMSTSRYQLGVVALDEYIYAIGGNTWTTNGEVVFKTVEQYDIKSDTWAKKSDMPTARRNFAVAAINNKIYAIGGVTKGYADYLNVVEEYDPETDTWARKADMPTSRGYLGTAVVNNKIYAIGGRDASGILNTVEEYDPETDTWSKKTNIPTERITTTVVVLNNKIYAIGGRNNEKYFDIVEEYNPETDIWTKKENISYPKIVQAIATDNKIYMVGGYTRHEDSSIPIDIVEEYNPVTGVSSLKANMPTARYSHGLAIANGVIYAIGGGLGNANTTTKVEAFTIPIDDTANPTNLKAAAGDEEVDLSWDEVTDADSYIIKRSITEGGPYVVISEDVIDTNYKDTDVRNGTTYYYVVSAVINGEESSDSNEASATPQGSGGGGSGDKAILEITMQNGKINEYDLSMDEIEDFIDWFEDQNDPYYIIEKDYNIGPFESRKDYIVADKILQFEVMEYED